MGYYMQKLYQIVFFSILPFAAYSQNPHGEELTINCAACHSPEGWEIASEYWQAGDLVVPYTEEGAEYFSHSETAFPLEGLHTDVDCRDCHDDLVFLRHRIGVH